MRIKIPPPIKSGDLVALLGPASPVKSDEDADLCVKFLQSIGLEVKEYPSLRQREDYLAGSDKQRADDINEAFKDKNIRAIFSMRGGYGSGRLLPLIDWKMAAKPRSRKMLIGFSDITSLIGGLISRSNLAALHGPMPAFVMHGKQGDAESIAALKKFIFEKPAKKMSYRELCGDFFKPETITGGEAEGILVGGNLSVFVGFLGTKFLPMAKSLILFMEDTGEKPYKLDRYITHLINAGYFKHVSGVVLGTFDDCAPTGTDKKTALEVLADCLRPLKIPVLAGLPVGHERPSYPLMMGAKVRLDATKGDLVTK